MDEKLVEKVAEKLYYMTYPGGSWDKVEESVRVYWRFKTNRVIPLIAGEIKGELEKELTAVFASTINPNPTFDDGSQEHFYMERMFAFQKALQRIIQYIGGLTGKDMG